MGVVVLTLLMVTSYESVAPAAAEVKAGDEINLTLKELPPETFQTSDCVDPGNSSVTVKSGGAFINSDTDPVKGLLVCEGNLNVNGRFTDEKAFDGTIVSSWVTQPTPEGTSINTLLTDSEALCFAGSVNGTWDEQTGELQLSMSVTIGLSYLSDGTTKSGACKLADAQCKSGPITMEFGTPEPKAGSKMALVVADANFPDWTKTTNAVEFTTMAVPPEFPNGVPVTAPSCEWQTDQTGSTFDGQPLDPSSDQAFVNDFFCGVDDAEAVCRPYLDPLVPVRGVGIAGLNYQVTTSPPDVITTPTSPTTQPATEPKFTG